MFCRYFCYSTFFKFGVLIFRYLISFRHFHLSVFVAFDIFHFDVIPFDVIMGKSSLHRSKLEKITQIAEAMQIFLFQYHLKLYFVLSLPI